MRKLILMLLLLSSTVIADRAGLVVQSSSSNVVKKCVEFQKGDNAFDFLRKSGLQIVTKDYGAGLGVAICGIENIGCSADNCFCDSNYWNFDYAENGNWVYSSVGISSYNTRDGDVLGFRWGVWGDEPEFHSFSELCPSSNSQGGGGIPIGYFDIDVKGNCSNEPFIINVKEKTGGIIWEPTIFFLAGSIENADVENGVGIKILLHQTYLGKDAGFEKVAMLFTDKKGNASFVPEKAGRYRLEFEKEGFLREEREIDVVECVKEVAQSTRLVEEKTENKEVEPNITRVDIIAPANAVVNSTVIVKMISETGEPLAYESILVEFSGGRKELITNESGEATFSTDEEGVYSYSSPNHILSSLKVTNIIKPTEFSLETSKVPEPQGSETAPSAAMAVASPSPVILGGGVIIILVLLYLLREVRK